MVGRGPRDEVAGGEFPATFFLLEEPAEPGTMVVLPPGETHHALRVLRLGRGAVVPATDGRGGRYRLRLEFDPGDAGSCPALVLERTDEPPPRPAIEVGLGAGRRERFLWGVEKLTELEVARVTPLLSAAVRDRKALAGEAGRRLSARARARAAAAVKQSKGTHLPQFGPLEEPVAWAGRPFAGVSLLLAMPAPGIPPLAAAATALCRPGSAGAGFRLAVGPEGGFLAEEERALAEAGFVPVHLGPRRLRFETAVVAAVCQVRAVFALEDAECGS